MMKSIALMMCLNWCCVYRYCVGCMVEWCIGSCGKFLLVDLKCGIGLLERAFDGCIRGH